MNNPHGPTPLPSGPALHHLGFGNFLKRITSCRLCWRVTATVFAAILAIEAILLGFSAFFYERAKLDEVERRGQIAWQALTDSHGPGMMDGRFLAAAESMARGSGAILIGGLILDGTGDRIGHFGELPALDEASLSTAPHDRLDTVTAPRRIDVAWPAATSSYPHTLIARLDASSVRTDVRSFISRVIGQVILIAVFVTFVTVILLHRLTLAPLLFLRERLVAAGNDLNHPDRHRLPVNRDDELGDVAMAFNGMLGQLTKNLLDIRHQETALAQANKDLEAKVLDRTQDLLKVNAALEQEIEERRDAEAQITYLARFPEENPSPVIRAGLNGTVLYANRAGRDLLGHWNAEVGHILPTPWNSIVANAATEGTPHELDTQCAGDRTFSLIFQPLPDAGYVNIYGRDVTAPSTPRNVSDTWPTTIR